MKLKSNSRGVGIAATALLLSACTTGPLIEADVNTQNQKVESLTQLSSSPNLLSDAQKLVGPQPSNNAKSTAENQNAVARWAKKPFVGTRAIAVSGDERLPAVFHVAFDMSFDDLATGGLVPINAFAQRLTAITGIPVRVKRDVWDNPAAFRTMPTMSATPGAPAGMTQPTANPATATVDIRPLSKSGGRPRLIDVLNFATDQLDSSFSYVNGTVVIERFISESLELDFGESKLKAGMGTATVSGSAGGATGSTAVNLDSDTAMFNSAVTAIREYIAKTPGSSVVATDFGRIMVTTTKETMSRTREMVRQINARLQTRIMVQFDVYHLANSNQDEKGFDWGVVYKSLNNLVGMQLTGPSSASTLGSSSTPGSLTWNIVPGGSSNISQTLGNSKLLLNSFSGLGFSSYVKSYPMLLSNRTWGRIMKSDTEIYISEIVPGVASTLGGAAVPGLKQSTITYGDDVAIKALLLDSNRICLSIVAGFGDLLTMAKADMGDTQFYVQQPKTSQSVVQEQVCQDPGETLILTGLSRRVANSAQNTLGEGLPIGLGGSRSVGTTTENLMVVVRATQM